jgi:hypothetical protein
MNGGLPDFGHEEVVFHGYVLHAQKCTYGTYSISGTKAQLDFISALPNVTLLGNAADKNIIADKKTLNSVLNKEKLATLAADVTPRDAAKYIATSMDIDSNFDADGVDDPEVIKDDKRIKDVIDYNHSTR